MLKLTAIMSLVLIGSTMWAASLSCDSCGSECTSACGTRHFRSCCFNYLRRKRIPDPVKFTPQTGHDVKSQQDLSKAEKPKFPVFFVQDVPEQWVSNAIPSDYRPYQYNDMFENGFFDV